MRRATPFLSVLLALAAVGVLTLSCGKHPTAPKRITVSDTTCIVVIGPGDARTCVPRVGVDPLPPRNP